ncbi:hypothetical protein EV702DRAFT_1178305 [Suillus placidus]|uniref:C2H2-type domain-containing protein n=1 Tax=Suillus placidus TaxID=48579 RepID=A0A9P7A076_9AGAM|nr:hypothetical protein EV702DRAFT_1178305 [Suillus placidus]
MTDCYRCNRSFNSWSAYHQHVRNSNNHWECQRCQLDFESGLGLKEHYYCDVHFDSTSDLQDHYEGEHAYCSSCHKVFKNDFGLHEHNRQKHADVYCIACKRLSRLRATFILIHRQKDTICPFNGCGLGFINNSALILHLESGSCRSEQSWNGQAYECVLCHTQFRALMDLNRHLASPRHQEKVYRCPLSTCQAHFVSLSGLCQHIESERCGVTRFKAVQDAMNNLFAGVARITM